MSVVSNPIKSKLKYNEIMKMTFVQPILVLDFLANKYLRYRDTLFVGNLRELKHILLHYDGMSVE